jgi:hypothetical protein
LLTGTGSAGSALPGLPRPILAAAAPVQRFQSGVVNDYVTWIVLGLACLGGVLAAVIR